MRELDETDLEILRLLVEDARRPYSEIAEAVELSPPTVSDRVDRLREVGVINRFTVDVDRSLMSSGASVLVDLHVRPGHIEEVRDSLSNLAGVEHVFRTADSHLVFKANLRERQLERGLADVVDEHVADYEVRLLTDSSWEPNPGGVEFALECDECGNTVTSEGVSERIDGELYQFCCTSCQARFEERYERFSESAT